MRFLHNTHFLLYIYMMLTNILLGIGLSMDCMTAILCLHAVDRRKNSPIHFVLPVLFAAAQTIMPLAGWMAGTGLKNYVASYDHWIAFFLLAATGAKMIHSSLKNDDGDISKTITIPSLIVLSFATSIDSVIAGMTLAFLNQPIVPAALTIGATTLAVTLGADLIGDQIGPFFKNKKAGVAGGVVIIAIGLKILLEHLFF